MWEHHGHGSIEAYFYDAAGILLFINNNNNNNNNSIIIFEIFILVHLPLLVCVGTPWSWFY